jgi:hypothetical protein
MMIFFFEVIPCILASGECTVIIKLESGRFSETWLTAYQTTSFHMLEDNNILKWEVEHESF